MFKACATGRFSSGFLRHVGFEVRHALPLSVFLHENVQEPSHAVGDRAMIFHHGFTDSGKEAGVSMNGHLNVLVFERNKIQGSPLEVRQMLRFGKDRAGGIRVHQIV
jgi:hypothetical protein